MKIVMDTNIMLAALLSKSGVSNRFLVWLFQHKEKINVVSNTLVTEYEDVLCREKNLSLYPQISKKDLLGFIDDICFISHHQKINFLWRPFLKDYKDDMVLETAFNAKANYIITYNQKDFRGVKEKFNIKVITPKEFLQKVGELK
jgi:putative PIN family toxin of toxin-antitoxin system